MTAVRYIVDSVDVAVAFYTSHLSFALKQRMGPAFALVERDGLTLWLSGPQSSAQRRMPDGRKPVPGGWNRLVVEVKDIAATVATLKGEGVRFRSDIVTGPGGKQVLLDDPSGNPVELFQPA